MAAPVKEVQAPLTSMGLAEQALTHLSDILKDRLPVSASRRAEALGSTPPSQPDVTEQLTKLAALRDAGVLSEDEFVAKKTELLSRL